jgi:hypothetical protein
MTEEKQQKAVELFQQKSNLSSDLATLHNKDLGFALCFRSGVTYLHNPELYCSRNKEINEEIKNMLIRILNAELNKIEEELKQL